MEFENPATVNTTVLAWFVSRTMQTGYHLKRKWSQMCRAVRWGKVTFTHPLAQYQNQCLKHVNCGTLSPPPPSCCIECFGLFFFFFLQGCAICDHLEESMEIKCYGQGTSLSVCWWAEVLPTTWAMTPVSFLPPGPRSHEGDHPVRAGWLWSFHMR